MSLDILRRFVSQDRSRPALCQPFRMDWGGRGWGCASDGRVLLMLQGDYVAALAEQETLKVHGVLEKLSPFMGAEINLGALAEMAGVPQGEQTPCMLCEKGTVACPECVETGRVVCVCACDHEHDRECPGCEGRGRVLCDPCSGWRDTTRPARRTVKIADDYFNAALIARAMADAERTSGKALLARGNGVASPLMLYVPGEWMLIMMPLRIDREWHHMASIFPLPNVEAQPVSAA